MIQVKDSLISPAPDADRAMFLMHASHTDIHCQRRSAADRGYSTIESGFRLAYNSEAGFTKWDFSPNVKLVDPKPDSVHRTAP